MKVGVILERFQPIHNGHLELIKKALDENEKVLILIGSADKIGVRNPIPSNIRMELVEESLIDIDPSTPYQIDLLDDLSTEEDNSHDWGFYLYSNIVDRIGQSTFTIYYSDGYEIITKWFPGFILRNYVSLSLLARNSVKDGISATQVRKMILDDDDDLKNAVPESVYKMRNTLRMYIDLWK
jgi:cytidyltransferase-like protein